MKTRTLRIIYSGEGSKANPEISLKDKANIMLTFWDVWERKGKLTKRMEAVKTARNGDIDKQIVAGDQDLPDDCPF